jgi:hypothetical protein
MAGLRIVFLSLLLCSSQAHSPANRGIPPAAATVSAESAAGVELFRNEAIQLTPAVVSGLNGYEALDQYASLFTFGNGSNSEATGDCKTYPGDTLWPSEDLWAIFDELLGNAISPIVPIASPCYEVSVYDNFDTSVCASVTAGWVEEATQSVFCIVQIS